MVFTNSFQASRIGDIQTLKSLPDIKPTHIDQQGACCLHYAARGGSIIVIEHLIKTLNFSIFQRTNTGATALHDAAVKGNTAVIKWLIENTEITVDDQDGAGLTAAHLAARYSHFLTLEWLLDEADADITVRSAAGALPLHFAVSGGDMNCVKILVDENPRLINMQLNNGATPVYVACQEGRLEILKYLISRNGATKIKAYDGMSCLHAAAHLGQLDVVKCLVLEEKMNPNDRDFDGSTPVHYAASCGRADVVRWLLTEGGAKVTLDNLGGSALHNAAELGHLQSIHALVESGCDVSLEDNAGLTAAQLADKCGQLDSAALIRGDISLPDTQHVTSATLQPDQSRSQHLRSPHLSFPPPPPFPPEEDAEVSGIVLTSTAATNTGVFTSRTPNPNDTNNKNDFGDDHNDYARTSTGWATDHQPYPGTSPSPPLPTPPSFSPAGSTPSVGSPISPPTPIHQEDSEPVTTPYSQWSRGSPAHVTHQDQTTSVSTSIPRTVSRVSVDSSASNFGIFEVQDGPVIRTVTAQVHRSFSRVPSTPGNPNYKNTSQQRSSVDASNSLSFFLNQNNSQPTVGVPSSDNPGVYNRAAPSYLYANAKSSVNTKTNSYLPANPNKSHSGSAFIEDDPPLTLHRAPLSPGQDSVQSNFSTETSSSQLSTAPSVPDNLSQTFHGGDSVFTIRNDNRYSKITTDSSRLKDSDSCSSSSVTKVRALFEHRKFSDISICPENGEICEQIRKRIPPAPLPKPRMDVRPTSTSLSSDVEAPSSDTTASENGDITILATRSTLGENDSQDGPGKVLAPSKSPVMKGKPTPATGSPRKSRVTTTPYYAKESATPRGSSNLVKKLSSDFFSPSVLPNPETSLATQSASSSSVQPLSDSSEGVEISKDPPPVVNGHSKAGGADKQDATSAGEKEKEEDKSVVNPKGFSRGSSNSSTSSQPLSPEVSKNILMADIQSAVSGTSNLSLRRTKGRGEGVSMVYTSTKAGNGTEENKTNNKPLTGQFDPKNFLDQVEKVDASGRSIPEWRRHLLAKHAAEKAEKEFEEKKMIDDYEARFKNMPAWKRALIEKKESEARE